MDRFILIDGNAIIHRAYHALPPLTSSDGQLMNAVYGFFSMFLKMQEDFQPTYVAVCFDRPKPSFRQELFVGYQAKRPKLADDLPPQMVKVHEVLEAGNVPIFEVDGYEADDLIGTLSVQAAQKEGIETIIVSGDRDLLQLVNGKVKVCMPIVGLTKNALYDGHLVEEKFGIKPTQIVDYKALVGDSSDNYPGVGGIGPKTASDLLRKYETFENIYQHLAELPEKVALKLATDAEQAALAKKLATIVTDAPVTLDTEKCRVQTFDKDGMVQQFDLLGFESLMKRTRGEQITRKPKGEKEAEKPKTDDEQLGLL